jgi:hypothetical protein
VNDKLSIQVGYLIRLLYQPIRLFIFEDYFGVVILDELAMGF